MFRIVTKMVIIQNRISTKIVSKLRLRKEKILSKEEIIGIIMQYGKIYKRRVNLNSLWTYLRKSNYIKRVLKDYYYIYSLEERYNHYCEFSEEELIFLVLEKMKIKWYLGLESALKANRISWQVFNIVIIINNKFSGYKTLGNSKFKFIKTKDKRFDFGLVEKRTNNNVRYLYSDLEKTYLDFIYFSSYAGKNIDSITKSIDFKVEKGKLNRYAKKYSKKIRDSI